MNTVFNKIFLPKNPIYLFFFWENHLKCIVSSIELSFRYLWKIIFVPTISSLPWNKYTILTAFYFYKLRNKICCHIWLFSPSLLNRNSIFCFPSLNSLSSLANLCLCLHTKTKLEQSRNIQIILNLNLLFIIIVDPFELSVKPSCKRRLNQSCSLIILPFTLFYLCYTVASFLFSLQTTGLALPSSLY